MTLLLAGNIMSTDYKKVIQINYLDRIQNNKSFWQNIVVTPPNHTKITVN
jgi:hypothetical protein